MHGSMGGGWKRERGTWSWSLEWDNRPGNRGKHEGPRTYRQEKQPRQSPTLHTFRPRLSRSRWGKHFVNFTPAVSRDAAVRMSREIRTWHIPKRSDKSLSDLARMFNPIVRGWLNYYGRFYKSMLYPLLQHLNTKLVQWATRKYKRLRRRERRARLWLRRIARQEPRLFAHWRFGAYP